MNVSIRKIDQNDAELILAWENNPQFIPEIGYSGPYTLEDIQVLISSLEDIRSNNQQRFMICLDNLPIGALDFFNINFDRGCSEIGILIVDDANRRKGIGKESLIRGMSLLLKEFGIHRFEALIHQNNRGSQQFFLKSGFSLFRHELDVNRYVFELRASNKSMND